jgi:hypothetical protein
MTLKCILLKYESGFSWRKHGPVEDAVEHAYIDSGFINARKAGLMERLSASEEDLFFSGILEELT